MVLVSATAFGTLSILAKLAYLAGVGTEQLLAFRFVLAAAGMWGIAVILRQNPLRFRRRDLVTLIALGGIFYTAQSLTYFSALRSLPASLCVLIAYVYPSLVVVAGWLVLRRSRWWRASSAWRCWSAARSFISLGRWFSPSPRRSSTPVTSCSGSA
jgi:drug/metabolite transporter (DMT)-like permease